MRKQEFIYLHALCHLLRERLAGDDAPADPFSRYDDATVTPTGVHRSKATHQAAVFALLEGIVTVLEEPDGSPANPSQSVDSGRQD